ncbi:MAG: hypothetical protein ACLQL2_01035 [Methylovirgula sp.]
MNPKPYGEMSLEELRQEIRHYAVGDNRRTQIQAELDLRQAKNTENLLFWSTIAAAIAACGSMIAAIASVVVAFHSK